MSEKAMGLIETAGYATALVAADYALKAANVKLVRIETVIGVAKLLGVTVYLGGEVAAVQSAVDAGTREAEKIGKVVSSLVIPNLDNKVRKDMFGGALEF